MKVTGEQNERGKSGAESFCPLTSRELCENMIAGLLADQIADTEERLDFIQDVCIINAFEAVNNVCKTDYKYIPQSRWIKKWRQLAESFISVHCPEITGEEKSEKVVIGAENEVINYRD
ncbi:MAG: hypothetical protein LUE27_05895 [Clostridia bacterium]|nr:hypothetical protein [Clostridia bacterium]